MKGGGGGGGGGGVAGAYPGKRRWRCLAVGVLFLVLLSMLVPLVFLLGLYNGFHSSGYLIDQQSTPSAVSKNLSGDRKHNIQNLSHSEMDHSRRVEYIIRQLGPTLPKGLRNFTYEAKNGTLGSNSTHDTQPHKDTVVPPPSLVRPTTSRNNINGAGDTTKANDYGKTIVVESEKSCERRYGSYCLWLEEHREEMKDSMVKKLKDQLFVARAYYPTIAKLPAQSKLSRELKQNIQEVEHVLSERTTDAELPPEIEKKLWKLKASIARAKTFSVECSNVDKKLRQIFDMTEDEANFHMKQSAFLYQLAVQTMPKSLHCLSMRLTMEYFKSPLHDMELSVSEKYSDPTLHHYVLFSTNVLASSVVINSTVMHAKESEKMVFHVLTDGENYFAMKLWFFRNTYKEAVVQVLNIEDLNLENDDKTSLLSPALPVEFRVTFGDIDNAHAARLRTEYVSVFSRVYFLLPYIFQNLHRVVVLDDDVVVQRDLSGLWNLNMGGKVNGALQLCAVRLGQLNRYLGEKSIEKNSCAWMSGLNVIDLVRWRQLDLTETFRKLEKQVGKGAGSVEVVALGASLLTFQDLIYALEGTWVVSGLGHDYGLDDQVITSAAVLHYNGKMKPWLELGIPKYKPYWKTFLSKEDQFLAECNVNP